MNEKGNKGGPASKTTLSGESKAKSPEQQESEYSPGPSCVSRKSSWFMERLNLLENTNSCNEQSPEQQENSTGPGCVSRKSSWFMERFNLLENTNSCNEQSPEQQENSTGPGCVSRKSSWFMERLNLLENTNLCNEQSKMLSNSQHIFQALPGHWDKTQVPETGYKKVQLQRSSDEYKEVEQLFRATMTTFDLVNIERIQNKGLWDYFQLQRDQMRKNNGGCNVAEKRLFHGTDSKYNDAICTSNFDWRICGTHGTLYGKGSYFARDASYSHKYTGNSACRTMFVSQVLVGHYTRGSAAYVRPPSKDGGDTLFYDSCVDDVSSPSIFVVFDKPQIYPEYLLTYNQRP